MKRILYLHAGAELYGADKVLRDLIKGLDKIEFEAHVILPSDGPLVEELRKVGAKVSILDYPILRRKYFNFKGIIDYVTSYIKYAKKLVKYAQDNHIDIIHNNTTAVLEGIYIKRKLDIPVIWHVHEIIVKPKFISDFINMTMGKYADKVITVSNAVLSHVKKSSFISDDQIKVIYNGVDSDFYKESSQSDKQRIREKFEIPSNAKVVGMIGRVNAWKGQKDLLASTEPLLAKYPDLYIILVGGVFAGEEWRMKELREQIKSSNYSERIILKDFQKDTVSVYNLLDIFVLPSTNPDPLPTVVLEAMATAKPVVGYAHGGVCEMVKEGYNGLLAEVRNPEDLSQKIDILLKDDSLKKEMSMHSRQRLVKQFSMKAYIQNFSDEYKNCLKDKNG